ncbi:MAG: filamentous hemagglutinin N-terminal domain-containing protein, partial [Cyanobacteria bacterium J06600_6]
MFLEKKSLITIGLLFSILLIATESKSQIIPDNSLPNNSNVVRNGNIFKIEEGTIRGNNLFHSFSQFSIPLELEASFQNGINIKNIFTRITSNSASNINGLISANGSANLFLINPNGIIFGENAQLNIGGSFLATTANAIEFND